MCTQHFLDWLTDTSSSNIKEKACNLLCATRAPVDTPRQRVMKLAKHQCPGKADEGLLSGYQHDAAVGQPERGSLPQQAHWQCAHSTFEIGW